MSSSRQPITREQFIEFCSQARLGGPTKLLNRTWSADRIELTAKDFPDIRGDGASNLLGISGLSFENCEFIGVNFGKLDLSRSFFDGCQFRFCAISESAMAGIRFHNSLLYFCNQWEVAGQIEYRSCQIEYSNFTPARNSLSYFFDCSVKCSTFKLGQYQFNFVDGTRLYKTIFKQTDYSSPMVRAVLRPRIEEAEKKDVSLQVFHEGFKTIRIYRLDEVTDDDDQKPVLWWPEVTQAQMDNLLNLVFSRRAEDFWGYYLLTNYTLLDIVQSCESTYRNMLVNSVPPQREMTPQQKEFVKEVAKAFNLLDRGV